MKNLVLVISVFILWASPALSETYWLPTVVHTPTESTYTYQTKVPDYMVPWLLDTQHNGGQIVTKEVKGQSYMFIKQKFDWDTSCCSPSLTGQLSIGTYKGGVGQKWKLNQQLKKNTAVITALKSDKDEQTSHGNWLAVNVLALKWDRTGSPNLVLVEPVSLADQAKARLRTLAEKPTKPGKFYPNQVQIPSDIDAFRRDMLLIGNIGRRDPYFRKGNKNANNFSGNTVQTDSNKSPESLVKNNSTPPYFFDLVLDDGLNKACQYMAEYYALTNGNESQPYGGDKHLGPVEKYNGIDMRTLGARLKHFAPGIITPGEGLGGGGPADSYPEGWMKSETHYRPWFNIGFDVRKMGLGIAKTEKGWYACKVGGAAPNDVAVTSPLSGTVPPKQQATGDILVANPATSNGDPFALKDPFSHHEYRGSWDWAHGNTSSLHLHVATKNIKYCYQGTGKPQHCWDDLPYKLTMNAAGTPAIIDFDLTNGDQAQFEWITQDQIKGKFWKKGVDKSQAPITTTVMNRPKN